MTFTDRIRKLFLFLCLSAGLGLIPVSAFAQSIGPQQQLVDRATIAVASVMNSPAGPTVQTYLRKARAVVICPSVFKAGFIFGGSGGACVLVARAGNGSWTDPAFYHMGGASFGLQAGIESSELMVIVFSQDGLNALLNDHFKFGVNASYSLAELGQGIQSGTGIGTNASYVAITSNSGLYAGLSLDGSYLASSSSDNQAYYNKPVSASQIVLAVAVNNQGADPLRAILTRYGG